MNRPLNTFQFRTVCLTLVCLTCIFSQTLFENDHQQYTILNRESMEVTFQSLLDEKEALLKEIMSKLPKCIAIKDAYNNTQVQKLFLSDIALGKPAKQSSTYSVKYGPYTPNFMAKYAVDGKRDTDIVVGTCSHTADGDINPWWIVDLQAVYYVKTVRILNRGVDKFNADLSYRLKHVTVTVGVTESAVNTLCGFFPGPGTCTLEQLVIIDCPTLPQGQFVKISMVTEHLTLCEVDVFGLSDF